MAAVWGAYDLLTSGAVQAIRQAVSPDTVALLKARGHTVEFEDSQGEVAAILAKDGWLEGEADPRTEGTAKGY